MPAAIVETAPATNAIAITASWSRAELRSDVNIFFTFLRDYKFCCVGSSADAVSAFPQEQQNLEESRLDSPQLGHIKDEILSNAFWRIYAICKTQGTVTR